MTLQELATEIMRQKDAKEDYIVSANRLRTEPSGSDVVLRMLDDQTEDRIEFLGIAPTAHRQIGTHLSILAKYCAKMQDENPALLNTNVNSWLEKSDAKRMPIISDGRACALFRIYSDVRRDQVEIGFSVCRTLGRFPG